MQELYHENGRTGIGDYDGMNDIARSRYQPVKLFVTITFDNLLVRAIEQRQPASAGRVPRVEYSPVRKGDVDSTELSDGPPMVFHLFGRATSMPEYAVTEEDVLEFMHALQSQEGRPEKLFRLLQQKNLLILGCGFVDWLARFFIRLGVPARLSSAREDRLVHRTRPQHPRVCALSRSLQSEHQVFPVGAGRVRCAPCGKAAAETSESISSSLAFREYNANSVYQLNSHQNTFRNEYPKWGTAFLNKQYGYKPYKDFVKFKRLDSEKHPEFTMFDNATKALKTIFSKMRYNKSEKEVERDLEPIIAYFEDVSAKFIKNDKHEKRLRGAAFLI